MIRPLPSSGATLPELRPFAEVRLIAIDIDGTLKPKNGTEIGDRISVLVSRLYRSRRCRVIVTVATGRAFAGARAFIQSLLSELPSGADSIPVILYNGSVVTDAVGEITISRKVMAPAVVSRVMAMALEAEHTAMAYLWSREELASGDRESVVGVSLGAESSVEFNGLPIAWVAQPPAGLQDVVAILIRSRSSSQTHRDSLERQLGELPDISLTRSGPDYLEVRPAGVSKQNALIAVCQELGLERQHVIAVGDNDNDVEMLQWSGIGVAVANASPDAQECADYLTLGESNSGVYETLLRVLESQRYYRSPKLLHGID